MEELNDTNGVSFINDQSFNNWVIVFKHSTRCSISSMALSRFESQLAALENVAKVYYLDLIKFRNISNELANFYKIEHESPQVLVVKNGICVYNASHMAIKPNTLLLSIASFKNN